ncbi:hypothetical protein [Devriesea agamarum]|uniref:hypothetical protein n=1 Tax=Devriesea agamarum TaxID=472569 RepID=UPI00071D04B5|nr:hypothetical protein [Devriesea agamarum]
MRATSDGSSPTSPDRAPRGDHSHHDHRDDILAVQERARLAREAAEHKNTQRLLREAVHAFTQAQIPPIPLRARPYNGGRSIRTSLRGWYLTLDRRAAVDTDGNFYLLRCDGSWRERLHGAHPAPSPAPLVIGRGGRDGESIDLAELIARRISAPIR